VDVPQRRYEDPAQLFDTNSMSAVSWANLCQNIQIKDELSNLIRVVLAFDELNRLLDWGQAAST